MRRFRTRRCWIYNWAPRTHLQTKVARHTAWCGLWNTKAVSAIVLESLLGTKRASEERERVFHWRPSTVYLPTYCSSISGPIFLLPVLICQSPGIDTGCLLKLRHWCTPHLPCICPDLRALVACCFDGVLP